jgi:hypothetical protein
MAVSSEVREAEQEARIALLKQITADVAKDPHINVLLQLAQAYNLVTANDAPHDPSKTRAGGFA